MPDMPAAELVVDEALVQALLDEQFPDLADRPIRLAANGWDNVLFRLGDDLCVRLPRRELAADLVAHEQRWLPLLAPGLPLAVPAPLHIGRPGGDYPWRWSVCPWFDGRTMLEVAPDDWLTTARDLGRFLAALHREAPADAPVSPVRGVPLSARVELFERQLGQIDPAIDRRPLRAAWAEALAWPERTGPRRWVHGDLHPGNLVVAGGRLTAVIDFGDLNGGDPSNDLAVAWLALPEDARPALRAHVGADDATWGRARGWALAFAVAMLANSADNPPYEALGRRVLRELVG